MKVAPAVTDFNALYKQWQEVFNVQLLNKKFYQELANWYFWSLRNVEFPEDAEKNRDVRNAISVIRLITRLIFIWFVKEKGLIPDDGFSDRKDNPLMVPDHLFFSSEQPVDLNEVYGTKSKTYKVRGLINILDSYKFTVDENTPVEEEIALDPELLGKVFENLPASYNHSSKADRLFLHTERDRQLHG